jgi:hypothetical protein
MADNPTPKAKAEQVLSRLLKGKDIYEIIAKNMRNQLLISGKTPDKWKEEFWITVPTDNLTTQTCKELDMKLMELHQQAVFYHAAAQAKQQMIKRGTEAAYNEKFWAIVAEHKEKGLRPPAAATLETMARINNDELESAATLADIEQRFWKSILDHLSTCRKLIENATLNISTELKYLQENR